MQAVVREQFPNVVLASAVEEVTGAVFQQVLARRRFEAIVVAGGPPGPGNAALGRNRSAPTGPGCPRPQELARVADELEGLQARSNEAVPVLRFLESVAAAPREVVASCTELMMAPNAG